jgi:hypothetical protein
VPNVKELKDKILQEAHNSAYSIHPGRNKMYEDHKATHWWYGMKREVAEYVAFFVTSIRESWLSIDDLLDCCNLCKYPSGSVNKLSGILSWHCLGLSLENDSLWVIMDRLAMVAHFVPINMTYTGPQLAKLYNSRIVYFHGVPTSPRYHLSPAAPPSPAVLCRSLVEPRVLLAPHDLPLPPRPKV